jgi:ABC-2 type transport system ATP-binding protein
VPGVHARGLVKRFDAICAVDHVSLLVPQGEVRGLLGPNGAGKTTLLRLLFGLVRPDEGSIELLGRRAQLGGSPVLDGVAGFVEDPSFYPYLSGRANLEVLAELDGEAASGRVTEALERVGLSSRADERVSGYSTGMKQRLGIAAALLRAPRLLLLDEPTSGLDPAGARDVRALLRELVSAGVTAVVSSHQIGEIEDACDSFTVLHQGRVVWDGSASQLRAQAPPSSYALHTSDDVLAMRIAEHQPGVTATAARDGGLALAAEEASLDIYTVALGEAGVAVRRLELLVSPLESMFFALTGAQAHPERRSDDELAREALAGI